MVSTSSARERRTIRPMASLPYLLACAPNSPSTPSVLPPPRAPPKKISNTWHFSSRTWARLPRGDQAILTGRSSAMAPRSIIAAYRARARSPPLPTSHCPSAPGFRSRNGALSPPHAIASACPSHDPARPPQLPRGQHERLYGLFGMHSCQRRDFERSSSHLTYPRLPATAIGLLDFCLDFIGREVAHPPRLTSAGLGGQLASAPQQIREM